VSFPRTRESSVFKRLWTPAFAGVTALCSFYDSIKIDTEKPKDGSSVFYKHEKKVGGLKRTSKMKAAAIKTAQMTLYMTIKQPAS
jgi:hypothetical protein